MPHPYEDEPPTDRPRIPHARAPQDHPRARHPRDGHPRGGHPSGPVRGRIPAWLTLAASLAALLSGALHGQGLLLATGLVLAGIAANLFDPPRKRPPGPPSW
ncbi:hypothetical protein ABZ929_04765 [Streptomyces physcomitrii]|uniref:hypothetical protein n=1 Tax=Streptomyces physcomitrii TaxID=2724184 RepID=UPI0034115954